MAGQKQPVDLVIANGKKHLTKEEIEQRKSQEIKADSDNIVAPSYLTKKQIEKFNYYVEELLKVKIIANLDTETLARQVVTEFQFEAVAKKLRQANILDPDYEKLLVAYDKLFKMCRQGASDLGLTVSSRCKLVIPQPEEKPKNKFKEYKAGGNNG